MQIDSEAENARLPLRTKLRSQTGEDSGEHVAGSPSRHPRIPRRIEVGVPGRRRQDGVKPFEDYIRAPFPGCFQSNVQSPRLYILGSDAKQAGHFARMRSQGQYRRVALVEEIGHAYISVEAIRIQNDWELRFRDDRPDELLRFILRREARTDGDNRFVSRDFRKAAVLEVPKAGRPCFPCGKRR